MYIEVLKTFKTLFVLYFLTKEGLGKEIDEDLANINVTLLDVNIINKIFKKV